MGPIRGWTRRAASSIRLLIGLLRRRTVDADLAEEISGHLEMAAEEYEARGMSPEEARRAARRDFGGVDQVKERHRAARRGAGLFEFLRDARISARGLLRRPGFTAMVVLTLGLGIGATTTVFSVVDGVLLQPLPYDDASSLVAVGTVGLGGAEFDPVTGLQNLSPVSFLTFLDLRERARSFEDLAPVGSFETALTFGEEDGAEAEVVSLAGATPGLLEMLDASPVLGRTFLPDEYMEIPEVVMLSYGTWQGRFGGDPDIVGRLLPTDELPVPTTVVGVLSPDFEPPEAFFPAGEAPEFWLPFWEGSGGSRSERYLYLVGRLSGGTTVEQARAEAATVAADLAEEFPEAYQEDGRPIGIGVNALHDQTIGTARRGLGLFLGAAGLLLLLAALNVTTLLLARALDRTRELGVRAALGAGRRRIVRLLATEAGLLSILGGAFGIFLAYGGVRVFLRYAPSSIPRLDAVAVDWRVLAVAAVVTIVTGLAAGLSPAVRFTRRGSGGGARLAGSGGRFSEPTSRVRDLLVAGQVALAVTLLAGAGLLFGSFIGMRAVDPGFDAGGLLAMSVEVQGTSNFSFDAPWEGWDRLAAELSSVPGVESVGLASSLPLQSPEWEPKLLLPGDVPEVERRGIAGYVVTPGYFETMGTEVIRGRGFEPTDGPDGERVVLVNESFVRTHLGGGDPIGTEIRWVFRDDFLGRRQLDLIAERWGGGDEIPMRIVGVVEDVVQARVAQGPRSAIYQPHTQARAFGAEAVIRSNLPPAALESGLRSAAIRFNPNTSRVGLEPSVMSDRLAAERPTLRFQAAFIGSFALIALLLAATGLYGSLAHSVGRRRREMGVRMALGADRSEVLGMMLWQGLRLSMAGVVVGILASFYLTRLLTGFLFGVEPNDPTTLLGVAIVMVLVSALASLGPARRAIAVDPVTVLRSE